jgi:hypothetical protein
MVRLLRDPEFDLTIDDVWSSGFRHPPQNASARRALCP